MRRLRAGQALLVTLMILAVTLTVGLAISSRSVTDVSVSVTQDEAAQALAAAEAGIEAAMGAASTSTGSGTLSLGGKEATFDVVNLPYGAGSVVALSGRMEAGEVETLFLSGHDENGKLVPGMDVYAGNSVKVCWGQNVGASSPAAPAMEVVLYYQKGSGEIRVGRQGYDPNKDRRNFNSFKEPVSGGGGSCPSGVTYEFASQVLLTGDLGMSAVGDTPLIMRFRLLYNGNTPHAVGVRATGPGGGFPTQGIALSSLGTAGSANQRVQVVSRFPDLPFMFDNAVFSGTEITR